jgi:hypothetical protein
MFSARITPRVASLCGLLYASCDPSANHGAPILEGNLALLVRPDSSWDRRDAPTPEVGRPIRSPLAPDRASPFTATVIRDPPVHAHHVQGVYGVIAKTLPDVIAEADVAIELLPGLARPHEVPHLLMQIVEALNRAVEISAAGGYQTGPCFGSALAQRADVPEAAATCRSGLWRTLRSHLGHD